MSTRQVMSWRIYVYTNSLYSLPSRHARSFREWSPHALGNDPCALHRIMDWANRDASVIVRRTEAEMVKAYETVFGMLSHVSMDSAQFQNTLFPFFGSKTNHFIHELINFARSPYEDPIAYELNVKYRAVHDDLDYDDDAEMPCTSAEALRREQSKAVLHSFVEFSFRMNNDVCLSFEADLLLEEEDSIALDELIISMASRNIPELFSLSEEVVEGYASQQPPPQPPQRPPLPPQQPPPTQGQPQQQQQESTRQGNSHWDSALQEVIARSILDVGGNRQRMRLQCRFSTRSDSQPSGTQPSGTQPSGMQPSGMQPSGMQQSGMRQHWTPTRPLVDARRSLNVAVRARRRYNPNQRNFILTLFTIAHYHPSTSTCNELYELQIINTHKGLQDPSSKIDNVLPNGNCNDDGIGHQ